MDWRTRRGEFVSTYEGSRGPTRTIVIGDVTYSELGLELPVPAGKKWTRHDASEALESSGTREEGYSEDGGGGGIVLTSSFSNYDDLMKTLEYLREYGSDREILGTDVVRGVPTTRQRARVDLRRMTREILRQEGSPQADIDRAVQGMPPDPVTLELWIDAEGLVRRSTWTYAHRFEDVAAGEIKSVATTEYYDFGIEVDVSPPPEAEVLTHAEWLAAFREYSARLFEEQVGDLDEELERPDEPRDEP